MGGKETIGHKPLESVEFDIVIILIPNRVPSWVSIGPVFARNRYRSQHEIRTIGPVVRERLAQPNQPLQARHCRRIPSRRLRTQVAIVLSPSVEFGKDLDHVLERIELDQVAALADSEHGRRPIAAAIIWC